jgi:hypothetical protein
MNPATITYRGKTYTVLFPDLLRPLTADEREDLRQDVRRNGVLVPVVLDENDGIIDDINRLTIAAEEESPGGGSVKVHVPFDVRRGLSAKAKRDLALSLNVHRRHLDAEDLRRLRGERIRRVAEGRRQGKSTRRLAEDEGVSESQVREDLKAATAQGCAVDPEGGKVTGRDGKARPATRQASAPPPKPEARAGAGDRREQDGPPTREEMDEMARQVIAFSRSLRRHLKALAAVASGLDLADQFGNDAQGFATRVSDELRRLGDDLFDFRWRRGRSSRTGHPGAPPRPDPVAEADEMLKQVEEAVRRRQQTGAHPGRTLTLAEALRVLGLTPPCTTLEVRAAYHRLAREKHPDAGGSNEAFQELQEAYKVAQQFCR